VALSVAAFVSCWAAALITVTWVSAVIYGTAAAAAGVGFVLTMRDYSEQPPSASVAPQPNSSKV
jgi:hypothetical protein